MQEKKILLVEDSESLRSVLAEKLADEHYTVLTAGGGEEGLRVGQAEHPDLIITDIVMFPMDGLEMAKKIRESSGVWGAQVYIIALSNQNSTEEAGRVEPLHLNAYLVKAETGLDDVIMHVKDMLK